MNKWHIPGQLEKRIIQRDKNCVYCGVKMLEAPTANGARSKVATWEHIINDETIITLNNIARCCSSCNSSKGTKLLSTWIKSDFCKKHGITKKTVAKVIKKALKQ